MAAAMKLLPALLFAFATWAIYTGGLSAIQRYCVNPSANIFSDGANVLGRQIGNALDTDGLAGIYTFSANVLYCHDVFRFHWFIASFEFLAIVGGILAAVSANGVIRTRGFLIAVFAIATVLIMIASEAFLAGIASDTRSGGGRHLTAYRVAASGAIMTVVTNMLVLAMLGIRSVDDHHREELRVPV